jgi:transcriptional regulator with XRE-family HTH domain
MKSAITNIDIGRRIASLRSLRGLTQAELAKQVHLSRTAITEIEQGNRKVYVQELHRLAGALHFSMDEFMSENFSAQPMLPDQQSEEVTSADVRVSVGDVNIEKLRNVLLYILERCAGKPNVGETVLNKLLYFADFNYFELYEEHLTGATYRKLPYGPVPKHLDQIMQQMIAEGLLTRIKTEYHGYPQIRYVPNTRADLKVFNAREMETIDHVIERMSDWSALAVSEYSHNDIPWKATENGDVISYELSFYRELPYSVRVYDEDDNV